MNPSVSHWGPTDALLHGAGQEAPKQERATTPMYASGDDARKNPLRQISGEEQFQVLSIKDVGQEFIDLLDTVPLNRELAIAKTKIEEAIMWAVKGVTS